MKRLSILGILLVCAHFILAQDNSRGQKEELVSMLPALLDSANFKLMVVPFEPKLYRSDIDRYIGKENNLNFSEIRGYFRLGLDNALMIEAKQNFDPITMHDDDPEINKDLNYIYKSVGHKFELVPEKEEPREENPAKRLISKIKLPQKAPEERETEVREGQVVTYGEASEKYLKTTIINPNVLKVLNQKYHSDLFLFINQLDLIDAPGTKQRDYGLDNYTRLIRIHYTVLDKDGQEVTGGRTETAFSSRTNDIRKIIKGHITKAADQLLSDLELQVGERLVAENDEQKKR